MIPLHLACFLISVMLSRILIHNAHRLLKQYTVHALAVVKVGCFGLNSSISRAFQREAERKVVVLLLFYVYGKQLWSCREGQLT